jgi:hypothetical protein
MLVALAASVPDRMHVSAHHVAAASAGDAALYLAVPVLWMAGVLVLIWRKLHRH